MNEFMECLADNGIEAGWDLPLPPPERGIDMAVTRRALTTCQQFYPKTQTPESYDAYLTCMNDNGVFPQIPIRSSPADNERAAKACESKPTKPTKPTMLPEYQQFVDCLNTNGLAVGPFGTSAPAPFDSAVAKSAWAACKSVAPWSPPSEYSACLADHGIIAMLAIHWDDDTYAAANKACEQLPPTARYPPEYKTWYDCLNANGIDVSMTRTKSDPAPKPVNIDVARKASAACDALAPKPPTLGSESEAARPPEAYTACLRDHGIFPNLPVEVEGADNQNAYSECEKVMPKPPVPEQTAKWLACLAKEGLVLPEDGSDPDVAKGRVALKACQKLEPSTVEIASFGPPTRAIAVAGPTPVPASTIKAG